jgi:hypothetical protein
MYRLMEFSFFFQTKGDHCLLLALPCGRDPLDVHAQTRALKNGFITYLQQKQAAGIINVARPGSAQVGHRIKIFPQLLNCSRLPRGEGDSSLGQGITGKNRPLP